MALDVYGIVTAVLGLLPLCRDGLDMIQDVFVASKILDLEVGRIELQKDRFQEWRDIWRDEDGNEDKTFEAYAKISPESAKRVLRQLALLSQALFDVRLLEDEYGLRQTERTNRSLGAERSIPIQIAKRTRAYYRNSSLILGTLQSQLSFSKKCKFVLKKKDPAWKELTDLLKEYNESLRSYGAKFDLEKMIKGEFNFLRKLQPSELRRRAEASAYEAKRCIPGSKEAKRYQDISLAANFSTVVKYERQHGVYKFSMSDFRLDPTYMLSSSDSSTMALLFDYPVRKEHRVVLIEWMDIIDRDYEHDTRVKALMLTAPKPRQLLLPTCYGTVEDPRTRMFGLVLAPPARIRSNLPPILPAGAISKKRMPFSLMEVLEKKDPAYQAVLDLGTRFRLAKKIVDSVHMMHCVGWIHKNIRSNCIIFFPARNTPPRGLPGPDPCLPQELGYNDPLFVGLGNARVDDAVVDDPGPVYVDFRERGRRPNDNNLDYYQHPDKRRNPSIRHSRAFNIYSLGCLLLEIGYWKPLHHLGVVQVDADTFQRQLQTLAGEKRLDGMMGSMYGRVVRKCLAIGTREKIDAESRELSNFCSEIATSLDKCFA